MIKVADLEEKRDLHGNPYFVGYMGECKVYVMPNLCAQEEGKREMRLYFSKSSPVDKQARHAKVVK